MKSGDVYTHILRAANTLFTPYQVVELRAIFKNGRVDSGYFDDFQLLAEAAVKLDERADVSGVYWTLNPVNPDCLHRAKNRMREWASKNKGGATTSDAEILERGLILLDFDGADRPAGISATQDELDAAKEKARRVTKFLAGHQWGMPIAAMSGNGYHLLYRTALPNNQESAAMVKKFLVSLALLFDDGRIKIDTAVFNASRISKIYGTVAKKGDDTPERPHRRSELLTPANEDDGRRLSIITSAQLETIAAMLPEEPPKKPGRPLKISGTAIDVPSWVREHLPHISITSEKEGKGANLYVLSECPFNPQHKAPDSVIGQYPSGAVFFKCFHNSCQSYDWQALRERFDIKVDCAAGGHAKDTVRPCERKIIETMSGTGLPTIELNGGQLRDVTEEIIEAIDSFGKNGNSEPLLYVRGDRLARLATDSDGQVKPSLVPVEAMPEIMSRAANFVRGNASGCVGVFPPETLARAVVNRGHWPFPVLRGVVSVPVLRKDGTILDRPGYDSTSELYYHPNGTIPKIPEKPDRKDAESAAAFILDILSDFPFQDEASRDNAVGLLLTVVVKELVGLAPMALIDAPAKGTGKTRLAQIVSIVASGHEIPLSPEVRDEEEWRKQITSLLIADRPVVIIDNVDRTLYSGQLAAVLTTSEWSDRILGRSEVLHLRSRAIWIATGNNIRLGGDIARRSYWIRLNSNLARPWLRDSSQFKRKLPAWAVSHRLEMVTALLTMARAWFLDGKPAWAGHSLGSYEAWSQTVGGILEYCGLKNFLANLESLYEQADDEAVQWAVFFGAVYETVGENTPFSTKALMELISGKSGELFHRKGISGENEGNYLFSPDTVQQQPSGKSESFYGGKGKFDPNEENNSLRTAVPDSLGDIGDKGFSKRLGLAMRKRKDQIFEIREGFIQLQNDAPDRHRQKPQWKLVNINNAPSAPFAPSGATPVYSEKIIHETCRGDTEELFISVIEGPEEHGAKVALGANEDFVFEDEPDERAAIQNEQPMEGGVHDGKAQAE